jgi:tetratricopeptide (TPR) repeat protein
MRILPCCCVILFTLAQSHGWAEQQTEKTQSASPATPEHEPQTTNPAQPPANAAEPMSDEDKANMLSDQVGKLMVRCVNLLTAQDPLSLDYCKQQRDLADQYPPNLRVVDKMLAHDEYGIALAAFDHKTDALQEFNTEIGLLPKAVKPGTEEWSKAYWHRAMIYSQLGQKQNADHDYRAAEDSLRKQLQAEGAEHPDKKMRAVLRQHAALLESQGDTAGAQKLLDEAAK